MSTALATFSPPYEMIPGVNGSDFRGRLSSQTAVLSSTLDQGLATVVFLFDAAGNQLRTKKSAPVETVFPKNAVAAVSYIQDVLQLTKEEVFKAVGVSRRTFFGWGDGLERVPRRTSLGQLWQMTHVLFGIQRVNPNFTSWFQGTPEAQTKFFSGDANGLAILEFESRLASFSTTSRNIPSDDAFFYDYEEKLAKIEATDSQNSTRPSETQVVSGRTPRSSSPGKTPVDGK